jgi:hypothetical protein
MNETGAKTISPKSRCYSVATNDVKKRHHLCLALKKSRRQLYFYELRKRKAYRSIMRLIFEILVSFIIGVLIYIVAQDIIKKTHQEVILVNEQIRQCTKEYLDNRCSPETRVPMLEKYCSEREACIAQDPLEEVRSTEALAKTIADVLNSLVSPLEHKTIFVLVLFFLG